MARLGYGWRKRSSKQFDGDAAALLGLCGDRNAWRSEALAAMHLLTSLASRPVPLTPVDDGSVLANVVLDLKKVVQELSALKGVISDHEVAIIELEDNLKGLDVQRKKPDGDVSIGAGDAAEGIALAAQSFRPDGSWIVRPGPEVQIPDAVASTSPVARNVSDLFAGDGPSADFGSLVAEPWPPWDEVKPRGAWADTDDDPIDEVENSC